MANERDEAELLRLRLQLLLLKALEKAEEHDDSKTNAALDTRMRMINSGMRCSLSLRELVAREDKMSTDDRSGEETRTARADELREEIERRLARIRASFESKEAAEEAYSGGD